jgi:hypothetical protein
MAYRSWGELREIVRSVIADSNPPPLSSFHLTASEEVYFRARCARAVDKLARDASAFKAYYVLKPEKPFSYVVGVSGAVVTAALSAGIYIYLHARGDPAYPIYASLIAVSAAAAGWAVAGWLTHRNTIRQNTNSIVFARFSHVAFGEAMHHFHKAFGYDPNSTISREQLLELRATGKDEDFKTATAVTYLLNYYEFISSGVIRGDLDQTIVRDNLRSVIIYYHDRCRPYIRFMNNMNPKIFENLIKLRTHYREP